MSTDLDDCLKILPKLLDFADIEDVYISMILKEIQNAYNNHLTAIKLTSNLYWLFHTPQEGDRVFKGQKGGGIYGTVFKDDDGQLSINLDEPLKTSKEKIIKIRGGYNKIVEDALLLNWNYISSNSLQYINNNMKLSEYEEISKSKPVYFVYHSNSPCKWCKKHKGTIVRLLPREIIENDIDELSHYGIDDFHAKTVIWFNKNNINHSKLRVCAFPHVEEDYSCGYELLPINLEPIDSEIKYSDKINPSPDSVSNQNPITDEEMKIINRSLDIIWQKNADKITGKINKKIDRTGFTKKKKPYQTTKEWYNPETGEVEKGQATRKFVPQMEIEEPPKDYRNPKKIGGGLVQVGKNKYKAFPQIDFNSRLEEWRQNPSLPIPLNQNSPQYRQIFDAAAENEKEEKK